MDNCSAFSAAEFDRNIRRVIPYYDLIGEQVISLLETYFADKPFSMLDTGCGTGSLALMCTERFELSQLVLCDPSEKMLNAAKCRLEGHNCEFHCVGSENLSFEERFDVITAIQSHHYFDRAVREKALQRCFSALRPGGLFICFENTAPFSETGKDIMLSRLEDFELKAGRTPEEVRHHSERYGTEFFPITVDEHLKLLEKTGFGVCELLWHSYMQSGFYAIKP